MKHAVLDIAMIFCVIQESQTIAESLRAFILSFVREVVEGEALPTLRLAPFSAAIAGFDYEKGVKSPQSSRRRTLACNVSRVDAGMRCVSAF